MDYLVCLLDHHHLYHFGPPFHHFLLANKYFLHNLGSQIPYWTENLGYKNYFQHHHLQHHLWNRLHFP